MQQFLLQVLPPPNLAEATAPNTVNESVTLATETVASLEVPEPIPTPVTTERIAEAPEVKIVEAETVAATVSSSEITESIKLETDTSAKATVGETLAPAAVADSDAPVVVSDTISDAVVSQHVDASTNENIVPPVDAPASPAEELAKPVSAAGVVQTVAAAAVAGPLVAAALAKPVAQETASPVTATEKVTTVEKDTTAETVTPAPALAPPPTILSSIIGLRDCPAPALGLGTAGLVPFLAAPAIMYNGGVFLPSMATAQLTYGATILSFLGGVRWGFLVNGGPSLPPSWSQYTWSVTPSLVAWMALLVPSQPAATTICVAGLITALGKDLDQHGYPAWFRGLSLILTLGAVLSLIFTLGLSMALSKKQSKAVEVK